ncbi:Fc.00g102030.m01.CDS01 [Cosmosporella sp. VM-42]
MSRWLLRYTDRPPVSSFALTSLGTASTPLRSQWKPSSCRPSRTFSTRAYLRRKDNGDPRLRDLGRQISDDYATIRDHYATPKHAIVLAHGLLGFSKLQPLPYLPPLHYWHGITTALTAAGCTVITASVPPSSSIQDRAAALLADITAQVPEGATVNIIAHSMGGLDARYMLSCLRPRKFDVASLVTVATPHRGSAFADYLLDEKTAIIHLPKLYSIMERIGLGTGGFEQLTRHYATNTFNPSTPDDPSVRYFSYGALIPTPPLLSPFRQSHAVISEAEGPNDGLVSVESSRWGDYKGTLIGVSHLDLINWSNRVRWMVREWMGSKRTFNAVAFYLDIADMLAKEGL